MDAYHIARQNIFHTSKLDNVCTWDKIDTSMYTMC